MSDAQELPEHPALKGFFRPVEMAKHVIGSTLKGAIKWGLIGAAVLAAAAFLPALGLGAVGGAVTGIFSTVAGWLGFAVPALSASGITLTALIPPALTGLQIGGTIGGLLAGGSSLLSAGDGADAAAEQRIADYERRAAFAERANALNMGQQRGAYAQAGAAGFNPGLTPGGRGAGMGVEA